MRGGQFSKVHRGDVRDSLKELFEWIRRPRPEAVAEARKSVLSAASDLWGRDDEKIVEHLRGKGFRMWVAREAVASARERWPGKGELSRFNVVSGLTAIAQRMSLDDRYETERLAGELLSA